VVPSRATLIPTADPIIRVAASMAAISPSSQAGSGTIFVSGAEQNAGSVRERHFCSRSESATERTRSADIVRPTMVGTVPQRCLLNPALSLAGLLDLSVGDGIHDAVARRKEQPVDTRQDRVGKRFQNITGCIEPTRALL